MTTDPSSGAAPRPGAPPSSGGARPDTDQLKLRKALEANTAAQQEGNQLQREANRLLEQTNQSLVELVRKFQDFLDANAPSSSASGPPELLPPAKVPTKPDFATGARIPLNSSLIPELVQVWEAARAADNGLSPAELAAKVQDWADQKYGPDDPHVKRHVVAATVQAYSTQLTRESQAHHPDDTGLSRDEKEANYYAVMEDLPSLEVLTELEEFDVFFARGLPENLKKSEES